MEELIALLQNANGTFDLGSMITLFGMMIAIDGIIMIIYAILKAAHGR